MSSTKQQLPSRPWNGTSTHPAFVSPFNDLSDVVARVAQRRAPVLASLANAKSVAMSKMLSWADRPIAPSYLVPSTAYSGSMAFTVPNGIRRGDVLQVGDTNQLLLVTASRNAGAAQLVEYQDEFAGSPGTTDVTAVRIVGNIGTMTPVADPVGTTFDIASINSPTQFYVALPLGFAVQIDDIISIGDDELAKVVGLEYSGNVIVVVVSRGHNGTPVTAPGGYTSFTIVESPNFAASVNPPATTGYGDSDSINAVQNFSRRFADVDLSTSLTSPETTDDAIEYYLGELLVELERSVLTGVYTSSQSMMRGLAYLLKETTRSIPYSDIYNDNGAVNQQLIEKSLRLVISEGYPVPDLLVINPQYAYQWTDRVPVTAQPGVYATSFGPLKFVVSPNYHAYGDGDYPPMLLLNSDYIEVVPQNGQSFGVSRKNGVVTISGKYTVKTRDGIRPHLAVSGLTP